MDIDDKTRWERRYAGRETFTPSAATPFLVAHAGVLPPGKALDLAMGEGRNAIFLARRGYAVTGVDIAAAAVDRAQALAAAEGLTIETHVVDLEAYEPAAGSFDVVVCTYYLQRSLFPRIERALRPGGMAIVETFTVDHLKHRPGFRREYLLERNELPRLLPQMRVLRYQEADDGAAASASLLAQKPSLSE
jgi:SAM-dependent methyltransferase